MTLYQISRRGVLGTALAWGTGAAGPSPGVRNNLPPLKSLTDVPVGCCFHSAQADEPGFTSLLLQNYSQVTPEFEMKMGLMLGDNGVLRFAAPDRFMDFAQQNRLRVHATTLIWYVYKSRYFLGLDGKGRRFAEAYRNYIEAVVGRYRGRVAGWDVVNEPVAPEGDGLRDCVWSKNLGDENYILTAFELARQADPDAVLFINDYNLEKLPRKRATFLRLVERLLKRGAQIDGIGTQTHIDIDTAEGAPTAAIRELAGMGLKIHVSELDVSFGRKIDNSRSVAQKRALQAARTAEVVEAFMALPAPQRYALTVWGLRDRDSYLRKTSFPGAAGDQPLPFDDNGQAKPMSWAIADGLASRRMRRSPGP